MKVELTRRQIVVALALVAAVIGGAFAAGQSLINGQLATEISHGAATSLPHAVTGALVSFATGLAVVAAITLGAASGRRAIAQLAEAVRNRDFPRWYLVAGVIGTIVVFSQAATVTAVGVARFTVAIVVGQVISGLFVDRIGFAGVAARRLETTRIAGAVLMTIAAVVSVWGGSGGNGDSASSRVLPMLLPLVAGMLISVQLACNGAIARAAGSVWPPTLLNFAVGTAVLTVVWFASRPALAEGWGLNLPTAWWLYLGGSIGVAFVAVQAGIVGTLGALLLGLGSITGQLLGGLVLAAVVPDAGNVTVLTVVGTFLALAAVVLGTIRRRK